MRPLLVLTAIATLLSSVAAQDRPNIILFFCDDLRADALGCMGHPWAQTPNIDALSANGTTFDQAFATTAICVTSRCNLLTGQHAARSGWRQGDFDGKSLTPEQLGQTYLGKLKSSGYKIGYAGTWRVGAVPENFFDFNAAFEGEGEYLETPAAEHLTSKLAGEAIKMVESAGAEPFFLCIGFKAPQVQDGKTPPFYIYDEKLTGNLYQDVTPDPPPLSDPAYFASLPDFLKQSINRERWGYRLSTPELFRQSVIGYHRLVSGVDHAVGRVVEAVGAANKAGNTVYLFSSDHGVYLGARGFSGESLPHEDTIRVPLIISDPRVDPENRFRRDEMALIIDLAPTILDLAGVEIPGSMQGSSLKPLVQGADVENWRTEFFYEHNYLPEQIPSTEAVRTTRFKYIRYINSEPLYEELYDLQEDPFEERNLIGSGDHKFIHDLMLEKWTQLREAAK